MNDACWFQIGVWSATQATCPKLEEVTHCRNCSVYIEKGRVLLERPASSDLRAQWTERIATPPLDPGALSESVFIFRLEEELFALETRFFDEVVRVRSVHTIPHKTGRVVKGFVSFRGRLELCVSLSELLGVEEGKTSEMARILVISPSEESRYLFPVTAVLGTYRFPLAALQPPPGGGGAFAYLQGVFPYGEPPSPQMAGLLDSSLLFEALARSMAAR